MLWRLPELRRVLYAQQRTPAEMLAALHVPYTHCGFSNEFDIQAKYGLFYVLSAIDMAGSGYSVFYGL